MAWSTGSDLRVDRRLQIGPLLAKVLFERLVCPPVESLFADLVKGLGRLPEGFGRLRDSLDGLVALLSATLD